MSVHWYWDDYGKHRELYGFRYYSATKIVDKLGLYLEGIKCGGDIVVYSYRRRKMIMLQTETRLQILETRERCNVIRWLKKELPAEYKYSDSFKHVLNSNFQCTLREDFWKIARIVWIGHNKEPGGMFNVLPKDMIKVILKTLFTDMSRFHTE